MTQLSKALTAETPEERWKVIVELVGAANVNHCAQLADAALREHFTNERTLFMAAEKGQLEIQGIPAHMRPPNDPMTAGPLSPPTAFTTAPPEAKGETIAITRHTSAETDIIAPPVPQQPLKPTDAGWQPAVGASVEDLIKYKAVDSFYGMTQPVFAAWRSLKVGMYPGTTPERRKALEALTPTERGWLLAAVRP